MEHMLTWSYWVHSTLGGVHVAAALAAMATGPVIFLSPKGTGFHRTLGRLYVFAMLTVNGSALSMYEFTNGPNLFHVFAVMSLATVVPGVICGVQARRTGKRGLVQAHYFFMAWSYVGLMAAFASQIVSRVPLGLNLPGESGFWIAGGVGLLAFLSLGRIIRRTWFRRLKARYGGQARILPHERPSTERTVLNLSARRP